MDLQIANKVVFITGAAGGIGQALAEGFAAEDARLVLHANKSSEALQSLVSKRWSPDRVLAVQADVSNPTEIEHTMDQAVERFGRVDICIVNAGVWHRSNLHLDQLDHERLRNTIEINLLGAIWTARAFMDVLRKSGPRSDGQGASMTFIGSTAGRFGEKGHSDYSVSKAGLYGLVRSLKNEIISIDPYARVNMVEPGYTDTPMAADAINREGGIAPVVRTMPIQQIARAVDIANAVLFFSSPAAARHVTGEILTVAGGMEGRVQWELDEIDETRIRRRLRAESSAGS